jgi:hypothetical protein
MNENSERDHNVRDLVPGRETVNSTLARRARAMHNFFSSKIYEIPRTSAARAPCASFLPVKFTVV